MASPAKTITPAPATGSRLAAMDAHRGLIMVLMALDHASFLVARVHSQELWGMPLPVYPDAMWFWMRWITHMCAPGFFFLMGLGMTLLADARRRAGWEEHRITRTFVLRGLLLILLQFIVENAAWMMRKLSALPGATVTWGGPIPGGGVEDFFYWGVLAALGSIMICWAFLRKAPSWLVALISGAAVIFTQFAIPGPDRTQVLFSPWMRILLIPGHTDLLLVLYPVIPWLGVTGLGMLFGRLLQQNRRNAGQAACFTGLGFLVLFVVIRIGGGFGNLNAVPSGWMGFLTIVKYPPSLAFLTVTLAVNLLLMAAWPWLERFVRHPRQPLAAFGRTALFFYLLHLWIYGLFGLLFRGGSSLATMVAIWLLGLAMLYPLCLRYNRFKQQKPVGSVWRFL